MAKSNVDTVRAFRRTLLTYHTRHGRHHLPWRKTTNPYRILVSEVMLQQTQVERVVPYYTHFLKQFPTVRALVNSSLEEVLRAWQGLGYNRRAKMLHDAAKQVVQEHGGRMPTRYEALVALPGVGDYTAKAVRTFAYHEKEFLIETNVRSVFIHHFFPKKQRVTDKEILRMVEETFPARIHPARWYAAIMDYGTHLKKQVKNPSRKSAAHVRQSPFKGSRREIRGAILRAHLHGVPLSTLPFDTAKVREQYAAMKQEGLVH